MCINVERTEIIRDSILAWKLTSTGIGKHFSQYSPHSRIPQYGYDFRLIDGAGTIIEYKIGEWVEAPMPGIYLFREKQFKSDFNDRGLLEVLIPAGTRCIFGSHYGSPTIVVPRLYVIGEANYAS